MAILITLLVLALIFAIMYVKKNKEKKDNTIRHHKAYTIEDRYNELRNSRQKELDALLEKINQYGYRSLSAKEQARLKTLSGK
jgi:hypothetical protein